VHIYLTYPFVLSWSCLEAMSCGCLIVGSRTPPVQEVIRDGHNGLLVDFFSGEEVADRVDQVLDHPDRMQRLRDAARQTVIQRYALPSCLDKQVKLIEEMAKKGDRRRVPSSTRQNVKRSRQATQSRGKRSALGRKG